MLVNLAELDFPGIKNPGKLASLVASISFSLMQNCRHYLAGPLEPGWSAAQRAKFAKKVHKPPLWVNVFNFELNGLHASIWVPWTSKSHDALIEVFKFIRSKLHVCTYLESETLKIYFEVVNLFVKVSRVCAGGGAFSFHRAWITTLVF